MKRGDIFDPSRGVIAARFLVVRDQDISREWYRDVLGAEAVYERAPSILGLHGKRELLLSTATSRHDTAPFTGPASECAAGQSTLQRGVLNAIGSSVQRSCNAPLVGSQVIEKVRERTPE